MNSIEFAHLNPVLGGYKPAESAALVVDIEAGGETELASKA